MIQPAYEVNGGVVPSHLESVTRVFVEWDLPSLKCTTYAILYVLLKSKKAETVRPDNKYTDPGSHINIIMLKRKAWSFDHGGGVNEPVSIRG